jgi:Putative glucoamylase
VWFTCNHYDVTNSEPRIATYLAIAGGGAPPQAYFHTNRTFPPSCDFSWTETQPVGVTRTYLGVDVFEGAYQYRGMRIVPSWGGDMFEALMPALFVPEAAWGPRSWGVNHPLYVRAQIEHGLDEAHYGYWGFSPSDNPSGGYSAYGVDAIGMQADGYPSNNDNTFVDHGYGDCRPAQPDPPPSAYTNGVVTPHASFLALDDAPHAALDNLAKLRSHFSVYGAGGFFDAVNVDSGQVARSYLALDQGMAMGGAVNALAGDALQRLFAPTVEQQVRPLLAMEQFGAG